MIRVFEDAGFAVSRRFDSGVVCVEMSTAGVGGRRGGRRSSRVRLRGEVAGSPALPSDGRGRRRAPAGVGAGARGPHLDPRERLPGRRLRHPSRALVDRRRPSVPPAGRRPGARRCCARRRSRGPRSRGRRGRSQRRRVRSGRDLLRPRGAGVGGRRDPAPAAPGGAEQQHPPGGSELPRHHVQRPGRAPECHVLPQRAPAGWSGRRLTVRGRGYCAARSRPSAGSGRADLHLPRQQGGRVEQRPVGRVDRRSERDRRRAVPGVVRQRGEVRSSGSTLRRAQAPAGGGGWPFRRWAARRRFAHGRRRNTGGRHRRPVRAGRRDRLPERRGHGQDRVAPG